MKIRNVLLPLSCGVWLAACAPETRVSDVTQPTTVETWASAETLTAGETLAVRCLAWRTASQRVDVPVELHLPAAMEIVSQSAHASVVTAQKAGRYTMSCAYGGMRSAVEVEVLPAPPRSVRVDVDKVPLAAGAELPVRCVGEDLYGNAVTPPDATFKVSRGAGELTPAGLRVTRAGDTTLSCRVPSWPHLGEAPRVAVRVGAGAPTRVMTTVDTPQTAAHGPVAVHCQGVDAFGNVGDLPEDFQVAGPGPVETQGALFTADVAGRYTVRCAAGSLQDPAGASLDVVAAAPARWEAELDTPRICYTQGKALPLQYKAWDNFGNRVANLDVELLADPPGGLFLDRFGGFVLRDEADYDLTLRARTPAAPGTVLPPHHWRVRVDSTPPALVVQTPVRGAMVRSETPTQSIEGTVRDGLSSIAQLFINGYPQAVPEETRELAFHTATPRKWGMDTVHGWAVDSCGNVAVLSQSYMSSPVFGPATMEPDDPNGRVPHAVVARLSQPLWDDDRRDTADDLATLLQSALADRALVSYLPEPLWASQDEDHDGQLDRRTYACSWLPWGAQDNRTTGYEIERAGSPTYDAPEVEYFRVVDDGWHVALLVRNLRVPVQLRAYYDAGCAGNPHVNLHATVMAPAIRLEFTAKAHFAAGQPQIRFTPTATHLSLPEGPTRLEGDWGVLGQDSTWGILGRLGITQTLNGALNSWVQRYADGLQEVVDSELAKHLERLLQRMLQGLRLEHSLALPAPWRGGLAVYSGVDAVTLVGPEGHGSGDIALWAHLAPHSYGLVPPRGLPFAVPEQGPIRQPVVATPDLHLDADQTFALAVQDDLLNQLLWGLWYSGAFTVPDLASLGVLGADLPASGAGIAMFFTLPPVLMPHAESNSVRLGLGDVFVEADLDLHQMLDDTGAPPPPDHKRLHFTMYVSGVLDARLDLNAEHNQLAVTPLATPRLHVQVVEVSDRAFQAVATQFVEDVLNATLPKLLSASLGAFPLPALQVGVLPGVPDNTVWQLSHGHLSRAPMGGNTVLRGTLTSLPPGP